MGMSHVTNDFLEEMESADDNQANLENCLETLGLTEPKSVVWIGFTRGKANRNETGDCAKHV